MGLQNKFQISLHGVINSSLCLKKLKLGQGDFLKHFFKRQTTPVQQIKQQLEKKTSQTPQYLLRIHMLSISLLELALL